MGKLKPIGSEKLQGMDKIKRMIQIATYNENIPNPVNETSSKEYNILLPDGKKYFIIKEKVGYVIKKGINESTSDYIEPMKGRKYYPSFSQAYKRLNLITKEINLLEGYDKNISLFNESNDDEIKYYLKTQTNEQDVPAESPAPAPAPAPAPSPAPAPAPSPEPSPEMETSDDESLDMDGMEDEPIGGEEDNEEEVSFKSIQKLTGKLAQKLRELMGNEDEEISSKDKKYVINSILSAIDLESMEEDDKEDIIDKLEGDEEMESSEEPSQGEEDMDFSDEMADQEIGGEDMGQESTPPPAPTEMGEMYDMKMTLLLTDQDLETKLDIEE